MDVWAQGLVAVLLHPPAALAPPRGDDLPDRLARLRADAADVDAGRRRLEQALLIGRQGFFEIDFTARPMTVSAGFCALVGVTTSARGPLGVIADTLVAADRPAFQAAHRPLSTRSTTVTVTPSATLGWARWRGGGARSGVATTRRPASAATSSRSHPPAASPRAPWSRSRGASSTGWMRRSEAMATGSRPGPHRGRLLAGGSGRRGGVALVRAGRPRALFRDEAGPQPLRRHRAR